MAWQDEADIILRALINDLDSTTYTDDRLEQILAVAAYQVLNDGLTFSQSFRADVVNIAIKPDPTDDANQTRDDSFVNLFTIKAAGILDSGAAIVAANRALLAKDGASLIDLRDTFKAKLALMEKGWNAVYEDQKLLYQVNSIQVAGAAIMTPFRLYAFGNYGWAEGARYRSLGAKTLI
jgi:hypothetical protein